MKCPKSFHCVSSERGVCSQLDSLIEMMEAVMSSKRPTRLQTLLQGCLFIVMLSGSLICQPSQSDSERGAISTLRRLNTAQVTYATIYAKGFAPDFASLGPPPSGSCNNMTPDHACLIDKVLGDAKCTSGKWCTQLDYKFTMTANCDKNKQCIEYVIVATPNIARPGWRNFCTTEDMAIHAKSGATLSAPVRAEECRSWEVAR
jgi:hypothetical protein